MEPATVIGLVTALVETYADGFDDYTTWKSKRMVANHYVGRGGRVPYCALATSLAVSGSQIKATYDKALSIVGSDFSTGDAYCRSLLWAQLNVLSHRVANLHRAAVSTSPLVDLADVIQVSEGVRQLSLHALMDLYRRTALGRPIPKTLTLPLPRIPSHHAHRASPVPSARPYMDEGAEVDDAETLAETNDDDTETTSMTVYSGPLRFQSEPPSPPPTPKVSDAIFEASGPTLRPNNSVFALFCPEAMNLQVNLQKRLPGVDKCSCGYSWRTRSDDREALVLKEGFKLTERYLAKSHVGSDAYGCVLCTSSGRSERYEGARHLRDHINTCHTKWQLLHDADCRAT
ncbi:hypothetical protein S7711_11163 [Stachybotrys chartarum IBT 7711]|uniref:C2H2-type domain-containing protein n=1 Tax=Stachybotrys chartarum (strain CBS 109288 / IBT 7711) TaxID=1280523 RepID=A0A084AK62_STACB|nr:hypothetical protein S7711_11163 [Stachybotrys chartarum IBT 7711]KFA54199.1 hypothetical protein S40293_06294 [Stachybotrys chartarum IBT 40293]KFA80213.1 hypothetical protein S40288_11321 [Stachybotrys chartarum IBT 40288]